jgi:predicted HAD superfamily Cof-like phosphohydrolase
MDQLNSVMNKLNKIQETLENASILTPLKSEAAQVREFTMGCGRSCPNSPSPMTYDEAKFLIGMMLSEIVELAQTVTSGPDEAVELVRSLVTVDLKRNYVKPNDEIDLIAHQADAAVDCAYYAYDAFAKKGVNLRSIFDVVHKANMDKRFPDGTFHKREDGKIIKPHNWQEPDIRGEVIRQLREGSWS